MQMIRERIRLEPGAKLTLGVDVGCGTGQSTVALLDVAESVVGVDSAEQMLAHAEQRAGVEYRQGSAESIPVEDGSADIVTASLAVHWFDLPKFLAEVARALQPGSWMVSYGNGFSGRMIGNAKFLEWITDVYNVRYPAPPRQGYDPDMDAFEDAGFELLNDGNSYGKDGSHPSEPYENEVTFSQDQLVAYLMTQSNIVAKVEQGTEQADDVKAWLEDQVKPFFSQSEETFLFRGNVTYARLNAGC